MHKPLRISQATLADQHGEDHETACRCTAWTVLLRYWSTPYLVVSGINQGWEPGHASLQRHRGRRNGGGQRIVDRRVATRRELVDFRR